METKKSIRFLLLNNKERETISVKKVLKVALPTVAVLIPVVVYVLEKIITVILGE